MAPAPQRRGAERADDGVGAGDDGDRRAAGIRRHRASPRPRTRAARAVRRVPPAWQHLQLRLAVRQQPVRAISAGCRPGDRAGLQHVRSWSSCSGRKRVSAALAASSARPARLPASAGPPRSARSGCGRRQLGRRRGQRRAVARRRAQVGGVGRGPAGRSAWAQQDLRRVGDQRQLGRLVRRARSCPGQHVVHQRQLPSRCARPRRRSRGAASRSLYGLVSGSAIRSCRVCIDSRVRVLGVQRVAVEAQAAAAGRPGQRQQREHGQDGRRAPERRVQRPRPGEADLAALRPRAAAASAAPAARSACRRTRSACRPRRSARAAPRPRRRSG